MPLLGIQIGVVSLVGRYMGAGRPEIAERVTRSGLKMGWSYSSVILVLFVGFRTTGRGLSARRPGPHLFRGGLAAGMLATGRPLRPGRRDDGLQRRPARRRGYLLDHVHLGRIALASAASALHHLKILQLSPQTAWLALVILFLSFSGVFYLRYRSGHWKTLTVVGERQTVSRE